ncbi:FxSxx-COOH system tetratricopeptide repeat protein [Amycolatopsis cihanbeyliensis]|uniref:Tetratricopeptide (TPR) repeat protein n=1 Tax=Amycolatopsis cihanbeyliensis TaxID=1128664 RepID=A0A542DFW6_AMYCI|nr:FxSxx-COOH system tetratricopeptide repeat protein [Amycolatopsis cihanbeyliensis]TQJ01969.1 tetratricopeptide (TPR) repeat protein [Amycolatopsis cihanbeyliensis]
MEDVAALVEQVYPAVESAVAAYGSEVLTKAQEAAADGTVGLGQHLLAKLFSRKDSKENVEQAVTDLAGELDDPDFQAALRAQLKKALREDAELAAEIAALLPSGGAKSISVGGDSGGINSTGDNAWNMQIGSVVLPPDTPPIERVPAPPGPIGVPVRPDLFVGREADLAQLEAAMAASDPVVVAAVHGLGGVGKSTLAARYVALHRDERTLIYWITAEQAGSVEQALARLATILRPELAELPAELLPEQALRWLAANEGWLLVLDNVDDPADIRPLLARAGPGRVLITSRRATGWHGLARPLDLDVLTGDESVELLTRIAAHGTDDLTGAEELCRELGGLPLAIEQAGAYLAQTGISPADYHRLLDRHPAVMFDEAAEGADARRTVARIWRVTMDKLDPLSGKVLRVLSWFAPEDIPRWLLDDLASEPELLRAIGKLRAYSMITVDGELLAVHRLVQAVTRVLDDASDMDSAKLALAALAEALGDAGHEDPANWPLYRALRPHAEAVAGHCPDDDLLFWLLNQFGVFQNGQGDADRAIQFLDHAAAVADRVLSPDHPSLLSVRHNLGLALVSAERIEEAVVLHEANLRDTERMLGKDDPHTAIARNCLGLAYRMAGRAEEAITAHQECLADQQRILGSDDPATLRTRNNLAIAYEVAGSTEQAIELYREAIADAERLLGDDHHDTIQLRRNLATTYFNVGRSEEAITLLEWTVADFERTFGVKAWQTFVAYDTLANAYHLAGRIEEAVTLHRTTLAGRERVLGPDHPDTVGSRNNLATACRDAGEPSEAVRLLERALADCARRLPPDHPTTELVRRNLEEARAAVTGSGG